MIVLQKARATEKVVRMIEAENILSFEVDRQFKKSEIKAEVEELFDVKVDKIRTHTVKNKKLTYVKLKPEFQAADVATKLGLL